MRYPEGWILFDASLVVGLWWMIPLLGADWNRNRVPGSLTSGWDAGRMVWIRIWIRHENWSGNTDWIYGWMVPFM